MAEPCTDNKRELSVFVRQTLGVPEVTVTECETCPCIDDQVSTLRYDISVPLVADLACDELEERLKDVKFVATVFLRLRTAPGSPLGLHEGTFDLVRLSDGTEVISGNLFGTDGMHSDPPPPDEDPEPEPPACKFPRRDEGTLVATRFDQGAFDERCRFIATYTSTLTEALILAQPTCNVDDVEDKLKSWSASFVGVLDCPCSEPG